MVNNNLSVRLARSFVLGTVVEYAGGACCVIVSMSVLHVYWYPVLLCVYVQVYDVLLRQESHTGWQLWHTTPQRSRRQVRVVPTHTNKVEKIRCVLRWWDFLRKLRENESSDFLFFLRFCSHRGESTQKKDASPSLIEGNIEFELRTANARRSICCFWKKKAARLSPRWIVGKNKKLLEGHWSEVNLQFQTLTVVGLVWRLYLVCECVARVNYSIYDARPPARGRATYQSADSTTVPILWCERKTRSITILMKAKTKRLVGGTPGSVCARLTF